jgi:hypothetical protein
MSNRSGVPDDVTTTVLLDREAWLALKRAALTRAEETGERPSASAVLRDLIRRELAGSTATA